MLYVESIGIKSRKKMEKALLVATFVLLFTECSVAATVKKPSPSNFSQDCPTTQQGEGCTLGLTKELPADSCYHIFTCNPQGQSGMYCIRNGPTAGEGAHQFFCELEEERCGPRGLVRVAHINTSEPCSTCPPPLAQYWANSIKVCGPAVERGCDSVVFPVHGVEYNYVCDRTVGYSFYAPLGLYCGTDQSYTIDQSYLSGLSITHGAPGSRNHVWSYAVGRWESDTHVLNCPCSAHTRTENLKPDYVGETTSTATLQRTTTQTRNGTPTTHCGMARTAIQVASAVTMSACHGSG